MYEKFQRLLEEKKITTYRVSQDTGIPTSTFSDWKSGRYTPKIDKLMKLADYFCVPIEYFLKE